MGFAESQILCMGREIIAKPGHQAFIELAASQGLEGVEIGDVDAPE